MYENPTKKFSETCRFGISYIKHQYKLLFQTVFIISFLEIRSGRVNFLKNVSCYLSPFHPYLALVFPHSPSPPNQNECGGDTVYYNNNL